MNEERKILDMLAKGQISVDQAEELLDALSASTESSKAKAKGIAKVLRISIDAEGEGTKEKAKVRVNVPIGLAKFAAKFLPDDAKVHMNSQGINLSEVLNSLKDDLPEGRIVDIDATEDTDGKKAKIIIEVV